MIEKKIICALCLTCTLITICPPKWAEAETIEVFSPSGIETVEGNNRSFIEANDLGRPFRIQYLYPQGDFESLPVDNRTLTGVSFRLDEDWIAETTLDLSDVELRVSTSPSGGGIDFRFDRNIGPDESLVYKGDLAMHLPIGGPPREFGTPYEFITPFNYEPSEGNLLIDLRFPQGIPDLVSFDAQSTGDFSVISSFGDIRDGQSANAFGVGLAAGKFIFVPEPDSMVWTSMSIAAFCVFFPRVRNGS